MALKTILNKQTDFTGEFPEEWAKGGLWRFNESDPDEDDCLLDSSGMGRAAYINNWSGTSASLSANRMGNYEKIGYARPVVLDSNGAWEAVLENAYDIIMTSEINGEDTLSFKIPYRDGKRGYIDSEKKIQIVDDVYKVRTVTDTRDTDGSAVTGVYAEAEFYDLTFSVRKEERTFEAEYPETAMAYALEGTEWSVGTVTVRTQRTWTSTEKNALSILRNTADLHGGDLVFDCPNRLVHLLTVNGKDSGALFAYKKNMKSIQRVVDTREFVTRLYAVGAEGMTFADINGGRPYVEDFTYTSEIRISTLDCSSFTNPYQMKEYAEMRLADYAKPTISYVLNAMDLSVLTGYEHEAWELGDYVRVEDKELGLSVTTRIVRREYNLQEPWNTVLELSTTLKNLGSSASQWDNAADSLEGTSMVSNNDIREMVPFNLLRNSRTDDGLAYQAMAPGYEKEQEPLKEKRDQLIAQLAHTQEVQDNVEQFVPLIQKYTDIQELTPHILNELIEKNVVHEKKVDEDGSKSQLVEIHYKFVGCIDLGAMLG